MNDPYYINFHDFSLERLKRILETGDVLPGRLILKVDLDTRFEVLSSLGMKNLGDLIEALSTKRKVEDLAQQTGLPLDYLVILRREVRSYIPKPVYLGDIPGVEIKVAQKLAKIGITHSKHFFKHGRTTNKRQELSSLTGIPMETLLELAKLSDLARIRGLGAVFVRLIYETGADTIEKLSSWDPGELFEAAHEINKVKEVTRAIPPLKDFRQYVEMAKDLPKVVEFL